MHLQKFFKRSKYFFFFLNPAGLDIMNYRLLAEIKIALGHKIWGEKNIRNANLGLLHIILIIQK